MSTKQGQKAAHHACCVLIHSRVGKTLTRDQKRDIDSLIRQAFRKGYAYAMQRQERKDLNPRH